MTFTESNTVEQMILDATAKLSGKQASMVRKDAPPYRGESLGDELRLERSTYVLAPNFCVGLILCVSSIGHVRQKEGHDSQQDDYRESTR